MISPAANDDAVNILLVDDKPNNLVALESFLSVADYKLVTATSGAEALRCLENGEFAVILTDVMMPIMDGYELVSRIKKNEQLREIPIIFLTAMTSEIIDIFRGYELGAVDFLHKPLEPEVVKAKVAVFAQIFRQKRLIKRQANQLLESERREQKYRVAELERQALAQRKRTQIALRDIANKKRVEQLQLIQLEVTQILVESFAISEAAPKLLRTICKGLHWEWAALWMVDNKSPQISQRLSLTSAWHSNSPEMTKFEEESRALKLQKGEDFLGQVWENGRYTWIADLTSDSSTSSLRSQVISQVNIKGAAAFPIWIGRELIAIVEFLTIAPLPKDHQASVMITDIAFRVGLYIQRRNVEQTLRESEEKFRLLVEGVKDCAIFMLDQAGYVTTWNIGAERIKGYKAQDIIGKHFSCFYTDKAISENQPEWELRLAIANGHYEDEGLRVRKDGSEFWANTLFTPLYDEEGKLRGFAKVTKDITERRHSEERLKKVNLELERRVEERTLEVQRRETQLRLIADAMPVLVAEFDLEEKALFTNDACRKWFSIAVQQNAIKTTLREFMGDFAYQNIKPYVRQVLAGCEVTFEHEMQRHGNKFVFSTTYVPELNDQRQVTGFILVATDITKHKNTEKELILAKASSDAANAAKSAFLANMSHEIRTPLGAVLGFSELMLNPDSTFAERSNYLGAIKRNGELLSNIINDILDLSKVEAGKVDVERQEVSLNEILTDITTLLNLHATEKGIKLTVKAEGVVPAMIATDPLRLRQILLNIVGNAIKFTKRGAVDVTIKQIHEEGKANKLAFVVSDTGPGIAEEHAVKLFEPFTQADASTKRKHGGTGLGLVLSKRLAKILGGDVTLDAHTPGQGSTFTVTVDPGQNQKHQFEKYNSDDLQQKVPVAKPRTDIRLDGASVLLVEDAPDNRLLVGRFLRMAGAVVDMAANGKEALDMINLHHYDAVLMDLQMPIMDGYEATVNLRKSGSKLPIIALTAHALKEERQRCLDAGFNDHICKPIDRQILLARIARFTNTEKPVLQ